MSTFNGLRRRLDQLEAGQAARQAARLSARYADIDPGTDPARALLACMEIMVTAWTREGKLDHAAAARRDADALRGLIDSGRADASVQAKCRGHLDQLAARMAELRRRGMA
jgi:hypothetical protein